MEIEFIKPKESINKAKITVHKTGKLGFSKGASELLKIAQNGYAKFGFSKDDFFIVMESNPDENTFNISRAGKYYYISAKNMLEDINVDYLSKDTTIFDIKKTDKENVYKLNKRVINRK